MGMEAGAVSFCYIVVSGAFYCAWGSAGYDHILREMEFYRLGNTAWTVELGLCLILHYSLLIWGVTKIIQ